MGYKIKVKVELVECDDPPGNEPIKHDDGSLSLTLDENDAISIDQCERGILSITHPAIRDAISKHLSEISKKRLLKKQKASK